MKKAAIIFLVFMYALSTTGFALKADYCCDKLTSVKVILATDIKDKEGCCKVKYQTFKVNDNHAASDVANVPIANFSFLHTITPSFHTSDFSYETNHCLINIHAPPLYTNTPLYLSNRFFRI